MPGSRIIRNTLLLSVMLLPGCGAASFPATARAAEQASAPATQESDTIYALHHMIIPGILFSDKGPSLFNDLFSGNSTPFRDIVEGPLGKKYASDIKITPVHLQEFDIVLLSFPEPLIEKLCIHAALIRKGETYRYVTLEKGGDVSSNGTKGFFCEWTAEYVHQNYGQREYTDVSEFRSELITFLNK
ncbi:MAG: hypothetical protein HGB00_00620 [Chlorobiaceae bacterium]|nr:hypothetical protein [Chlorobiaceae bacterium]